jgi:dTDP-glucose 4,6-dehydratase
VDPGNTERDGYVRADVRNFRQLERIFDKHRFDSVYPLAAEYGRWNGEDYYENLWQTNCIGTKNMLSLFSPIVPTTGFVRVIMDGLSRSLNSRFP